MKPKSEMIITWKKGKPRSFNRAKRAKRIL